MTAQIKRLDRQEISQLISVSAGLKLEATDWVVMDQCLSISTELWVGLVEKQFVCAWGLIPPTLMSNQAYLWLFTTEAIEGNEFLFVRNSQRALEDMLKLYPSIVGQCHASNHRGMRWLRWLGASFKEPDGQIIPFVIRRKG